LPEARAKVIVQATIPSVATDSESPTMFRHVKKNGTNMDRIANRMRNTISIPELRQILPMEAAENGGDMVDTVRYLLCVYAV
jgi:hypothetical protein